MLLVTVFFWVSCQAPQKASDAEVSQPTTSQTFVPVLAQNPNTIIERIAFGSCNKQNLPQPMWTEILSFRPQLWVWLGDNIYGDTEDMSVLAEKYALQKANENYQKLRANVPIIGIWDDHDYGVNDGDKTYPFRAQARDLMFQFLDVPQENAAWQREGGYNAYTFGDDNRTVKVILLDGRYFRDILQPDTVTEQRYHPNQEGDLLGEAQWAWLEKELLKNEAALHIIGCGIQFLPEEHPFEKWANFPKARKRLLDLLVKTQAKHPILISGDRHIGEISRMDYEGLAHPLYEVTSSGLTHSYEKAKDEPNRHRISPLVNQKHFATLELDWNAANPPQVSLSIRGLNDTVYAEQIIRW